jgi:hypothetical protein
LEEKEEPALRFPKEEILLGNSFSVAIRTSWMT